MASGQVLGMIPAHRKFNTGHRRLLSCYYSTHRPWAWGNYHVRSPDSLLKEMHFFNLNKQRAGKGRRSRT